MPAAMLIPAALGAAESVVGLINSGKAKEEAEQLKRSRPKYSIPADAQRELDLSESELGTGGLSARAESAYTQLNNRQFSSSLDAMLRMGGSPGQVSEIFDNSEAGRLKLAQLNDEMRLQKINNLVSSRRYMNEQRDKQFEFNEWMPWADRAQANAEARQNAENMIWSGVDTAAGGITNFATQKSNENMWDKYLSGMNSGSSSGVPMTRDRTPAQPIWSTPQQPRIGSRRSPDANYGTSTIEEVEGYPNVWDYERRGG